MATCHLQCTLQVTDVASPSDGRRLTEADWRGGVAAAADVVATAALVSLGDPRGPDARTYVVDGLLDEPRVRLLEGRGGALFADE